MLIVIAIMAILVFVAIGSFTAARRSAKLDIAADSIVSEIRAMRSATKVGRVENVDDQVKCYGLLISKEEPYVRRMEMDYASIKGNEADICDASTVVFSGFESIEDLEISVIEKFEIDVDDVAIVFKPPFGDGLVAGENLVFEDSIPAEKEIYINVSIPNRDEIRTIKYNALNGNVERLYVQQ